MNLIWCMMLACVCSLMHGSWLMGASQVTSSNLLVQYSFGYFEISTNSLVNLTTAFFPVFLFQIIEGIAVFKQFCVADVYVFSRCKSRSRWFLAESAKIFLTSVAYSAAWYICGIALACWRGILIMEHGFWNVFFIQMLILALWLYGTTMLINIIAIWFGSYPGIGIVIVLQIFFISILKLWEDDGVFSLLPENADAAMHAGLLKQNPVSHLILAWHSMTETELQNYTAVYDIGLYLYESVAYMLILAGCITIAGALLIKRVEFVSNNRKN